MMAALAIEQVVTTTYRVVCSEHGEIARGLTFKEANEAHCHKCVDAERKPPKSPFSAGPHERAKF